VILHSFAVFFFWKIRISSNLDYFAVRVFVCVTPFYGSSGGAEAAVLISMAAFSPSL